MFYCIRYILCVFYVFGCYLKSTEYNYLDDYNLYPLNIELFYLNLV
jgi:hypothetical protein